MAILLKEIAFNYTQKDQDKQFWDYFAMYDVWSRFGSGAPGSEAPMVNRKTEMVNDLFGQVQDAFSDSILNSLVTNGIKIRETDTRTNEVDKMQAVSRKLVHAKKVHDRALMHSAISEIFTNELRNILAITTISVASVSKQRRIHTGGNPGRYLPLVSPEVAKMIQAILPNIIGYDKAGGEKGKETLVINEPREDWTPEEKEKVLGLGLNVYGNGNSAAVIKGYNKGIMKIHFDKLKNESYIFFTFDKSEVETFPTFEAAEEYINKNWKSRLSGRGIDRTLPPSPSTPPSPPIVPPPVPKDIAPLGAPMAGGEPKKLGGFWDDQLKSFGFTWNDDEKKYIGADGSKVVVLPDNSVIHDEADGNVDILRNLGLLFRKLLHKRKNQEPVAQVNEENYKELFKFLYD